MSQEENFEENMRAALRRYAFPESEKACRKRCRRKLKQEVLEHYGTICPCGFSDQRALSIDHINGKGTKHRRQIGASRFYIWLRKNNFPDGYQVLCMNCQFIKRYTNNEI